MAMNKKEQEQMRMLRERLDKAEGKAAVLDDLMDFIYKELKDEIVRIAEEAVEEAASNLQVSL